ncbi:hypothetical protein AAFA46_08270 [Oscillospiraceae bacterium WX1]
MKKIFRSLLLVLLGVAVGITASLASYYISGDTVFKKIIGSGGGLYDSAPIRTDASNAELKAYADRILEDIKSADYEALSQVIHPEYGLVFSPYATINLAAAKRFTPAEVAAFSDDQNKYVWGKYDGSGNPIEMTPDAYFKTFVFDKDYTAYSAVGVDYIIKTGNALENIKEVFPDVRFVDYYIDGTAGNGGLDWSCLRLGFEEDGGQLKLTVIVHSQWTI